MRECEHTDYTHGVGPNDVPCNRPGRVQVGNIRTFSTSRGASRAELLPNGYVRVDTCNDQPRLWERDPERICCRLRSGYPEHVNGAPGVFVSELAAVAALLRCSPHWVQ
jgi:hypothetical protein